MSGLRMPPSACPKCGKVLDRATDASGGEHVPTPGALTICIACESVAVFDAGLRLREPVQADWDSLTSADREQLMSARCRLRSLKSRHDGKFAVQWRDADRKPQSAPDPAYPDGMDVDARTNKGAPDCTVELVHPTHGCGLYLLRCLICGTTVWVTTAGRPDDPRSVRVTCKLMATA